MYLSPVETRKRIEATKKACVVADVILVTASAWLMEALQDLSLLMGSIFGSL